MTYNKHQYSLADRDTVYRVIKERRDMRHFRKAPIDAEVMQRLFKAAHQAPSVGLMQPWRIIQIKDNALRSQIAELVEQERINTAKALGEREQKFMQLKVEGIIDCGELLVMALMDKREQYIFGRRTLPDMDLASVACAIQNMWLAARAEGIGMGWVSLFEPDKLATLLNMPEDAEPVAILCLGHVDEFYKKPMLEQENWAISRDIDEVIFTNTWSNQANT
jgi:5,6-dimethylbenzimidazole synthase